MSQPRLRRIVGLLAFGTLLSLALTAASGGAALATAGGAHGGPSGFKPTGQGKPTSGPANLIDHGGPVLLHSRVVEIFWGPQADFDPDVLTAMPLLMQGMNGSAYLGVAGQYMHASGISTTWGGVINDTTTPPKQALSTADLGAEVARKVPSPDPSTLYIVFTSNLPHISYCAYHDSTTANGVVVQVAYVPRQPAGCSPLGSVNLHANSYSTGAQAAADSAAHEFMEAVTDPHLNAWYDKNGYEIADKCEYDYQGVVTLANGSTWQIQSNWSNALRGGACDPGLGS